MSVPSESYLKVAYDLRPAKQIERRMFIDALQRLSLAGFDIGDYQYTGFGSIFFVDFILFHKLLGLNRLLSVEYSEKIEKRVEFNRPFKQVEISMKSITDIIPTLSADRKHLLWLDYDDVLQKNHIADLVLAGTYLSPGSIVLVTVDVQPPGGRRRFPSGVETAFRGSSRRIPGAIHAAGEFCRVQPAGGQHPHFEGSTRIWAGRPRGKVPAAVLVRL